MGNVSLREIRAWLDTRFRNNDMLVALLQDEFDDVAFELTAGMTRTQKLNVLFSMHAAEDVATRLTRRGFTRAAEGSPTPREDSRAVLIVTADPLDMAANRVAPEIRHITEAMGVDRVQVLHNATFDQLVDALSRCNPRVFHFIGHGHDSSKNLLFVDGEGNAAPINKDTVAAELASCTQLELVVLNACHSYEQAMKLHNRVPCAIGMARKVSNAGGITFAKRLYGRLADGDPVGRAFATATEAMAASADHMDESQVPRLVPADDIDVAALQLNFGEPNA